MMMIIEKDEKEGKEKKRNVNFPTTDSTPYRSDYLYLQPCLSSGHSCKVRYSCFFEFFFREGPEKCRQPSTHAHECRMGPSVRLS